MNLSRWLPELRSADEENGMAQRFPVNGMMQQFWEACKFPAPPSGVCPVEAGEGRWHLALFRRSRCVAAVGKGQALLVSAWGICGKQRSLFSSDFLTWRQAQMHALKSILIVSEKTRFYFLVPES